MGYIGLYRYLGAIKGIYWDDRKENGIGQYCNIIGYDHLEKPIFRCI